MILLQYPLTTKPKISITTTASTSQTIQQLRKAVSYLLSAFLGMLPYKHQAAIFPCSIHSYTEYKLTTQFSKSKNYFIFPSGERKYFNIWEKENILIYGIFLLQRVLLFPLCPPHSWHSSKFYFCCQIQFSRFPHILLCLV